MSPPQEGEEPEGMGAEADAFAKQVAQSDGANDAPWLAEEPGPASPEPAPVAGKPETPPAEKPPESPAPSAGQPAEGQATPKSEEAGEKTAEGAEKEGETISPEDAAKIERHRLGLSDVEPESVETLKERVAASTREGKSLRGTLNQVLDLVARSGSTVAELDDGTLGLVPLDSYWEELSELPLEYADQPAEFREKVTEEEFNAIQKDTAAALSAARPQPTATPEQVRLPVAVLDECFDEMGVSKVVVTGDPLFPEIQDPDIQERMFNLYNEDQFEPFRAAMNTSKVAMKMGLTYLYSRVAWVLGPQKAAKADAAAAKIAEAEKRKRDVHPTVQAAAEATGQPQGSEADDFARQIAYSDGVGGVPL